MVALFVPIISIHAISALLASSELLPAVNSNLLPDPISIYKFGRCVQIRLIYFSSFHYEHAHNLLMVLLFFDVAFIKKKETSPSYNLLFDIFLGCCSSGLRLMNDLEWRREYVRERNNHHKQLFTHNDMDVVSYKIQ